MWAPPRQSPIHVQALSGGFGPVPAALDMEASPLMAYARMQAMLESKVVLADTHASVVWHAGAHRDAAQAFAVIAFRRIVAE